MVRSSEKGFRMKKVFFKEIELIVSHIDFDLGHLVGKILFIVKLKLILSSLRFRFLATCIWEKCCLKFLLIIPTACVDFATY